VQVTTHRGGHVATGDGLVERGEHLGAQERRGVQPPLAADIDALAGKVQDDAGVGDEHRVLLIRDALRDERTRGVHPGACREATP
jgi:hypothetical protein